MKFTKIFLHLDSWTSIVKTVTKQDCPRPRHNVKFCFKICQFQELKKPILYNKFMWSVDELKTLDILLFSDLAYLQFFGDDFLRLLILRFVFCYVVLRNHEVFKVGVHQNVHTESLFSRSYNIFRSKFSFLFSVTRLQAQVLSAASRKRTPRPSGFAALHLRPGYTSGRPQSVHSSELSCASSWVTNRVDH